MDYGKTERCATALLQQKVQGGAMANDLDNIEALEAKETEKKLPLGWLLLFWALILWGIYYCVAETPWISGWSQGKAYEESISK